MSKDTPEGDRPGRSPSSFWQASEVFIGRYICHICGCPIEPQYLTEQGVCMDCDEKLRIGRMIIPMIAENMIPTQKSAGFDEILKTLKKGTAPAMVGMAEAILQEAGGHEKIGQAIWQDLKKIRGEGLEDWQRVTHVTDYKVLKQMYDLVQRIMSARDEMIGNAGDPLEGLSEEDLMVVVAEASRIRITTDEQFRQEMLALIDQTDPDLIEQRYLSRFGIPSVKVQDAPVDLQRT